MSKRHIRYYIVSTKSTIKYVKLESDLPFSIHEGKKSLKESYPRSPINHIAKSKAEIFLGLN